MLSRSCLREVLGPVAALLVLPVATFAGTDVKVNSDLPGSVQNEIRITLNATDASNLVVAYNDAIGAIASPLGVSYSLDAGLSWADTQLTTPMHPTLPATPLGFIFDPFIDSDSQGNVYAGYIASTGLLGASGLFIERSQNKGQTWSGPSTIAFDTAAMPPPPPPLPDPYRFNDRPDMTVDGSDNVYVVWIKDVGQGPPAPATSDIYFAKSPPPGPPAPPTNPTGLDFTGLVANSVAPQTVNDNPGGGPTPPVSDLANVPDVAVASDGTVYVAWIDVDVSVLSSKPGTLLIDRSFDGGVNFGADQTVQNITALASNLATAAGTTDARSGSYPAIAVDPANPQTVYLVYAADPAAVADEADIFFLKSTDAGISWSTPLLVNDDGTSTDQFHPMIAVKPDGTIDVAWYDKRNSAGDDMWDVYFAGSIDGGASFSANVRVTDQSFATPTDAFGAPWLGEYLGLELDATDAYLAFTSSSTDARGDVFFDRVPNVRAFALTEIPVLGPAGLALLAALVGIAGVLLARRPRAR